MIIAQKQTVGLNKGAATRVSEKPTSPPTLAEAGIDKNLANRARKIAAVPEKKFEGMIGEWRERVQEENERVTANLMEEGSRTAHVSHNAGDNEGKESGVLAKKGQPKKSSDSEHYFGPAKFAEAGIDKKLSARAPKYQLEILGSEYFEAAYPFKEFFQWHALCLFFNAFQALGIVTSQP